MRHPFSGATAGKDRRVRVTADIMSCPRGIMVALRKGVGRPTGIDPLRMEPTRITCLAKEDWVRNRWLQGDSGRLAPQLEVARIRDLAERANGAKRGSR